jgi:hypothetical protein
MLALTILNISGWKAHAQCTNDPIASLSEADAFTQWVLSSNWTVELTSQVEVCGLDGDGLNRTNAAVTQMIPIPFDEEVWQLELEVIGEHTARLMVRGETGPLLATYRFDYSALSEDLEAAIANERLYPEASVNRGWQYCVDNTNLVFRGAGPQNYCDLIPFPLDVTPPQRQEGSSTNGGGHYEWGFGIESMPSYGWTRQFGTSGHDIGVSVVSEGSDVYVAGEAAGSIDGQTFAGVVDFVLRKYNSSGVSQWTRMWGSTSSEEACGIFKSGTNIYVSGNARASVDGQPFAGNRDFCLTKYGADGTRLWVRMRGTSANDYGRGVVVDSSGNVYLAGLVGAALDSQTYSGNGDPCLIKYDAAGNWQWTRIWGSAGSERVFGAAIDGNDNIYVAGTTSGSFGGQTNAGNGDFFVSKFDTSGNRAWDRIFGTSGEQIVSIDDRGNNVGADVCGFVAVVGSSGNLGGPYEAYLRQYDDSGIAQWTATWGSTGNE